MISFRKEMQVWTLLVSLTFFSVTVAFGQVVTGTILGRVTDTTGAVIPSATVQVQNVDTGFSQTAQTDSGGRYLSRNLPLGTYTVTVQQRGFQSQVRHGIVLSVASEVTVNMELAVGNVQEKVEVTAEAPLVETTNATVSGLVNPEQIRNLPLNGRNIESLALLAPGVLANPYTPNNGTSLGNGLRLSINGGRRDANLYLLDGTVVNDHQNGGPSSVAQQALGVEGILEFRLLTHSFSAEYGKKSGAIISEVTRSGTNQFHGSAYEFVRNDLLDARNFFNPGDLPAFKRNQFGASLGGRIIKDKLFFFVNYEGLRQRQGNTLIAFVPDVNARQGLVPNATTGQLQPVTVNPAVRPYLDLFPLPNGPLLGDGTAEFISSPSVPTDEDYSMQRMDFRISDKDNLYWRNVFDRATTVNPTPVPPFAQNETTTNHFVVLSESHVFSATSLNELRVAFNRSDPVNILQQPNIPSLVFVPGQPLGGIQFTTSGVTGGGTQLTSFGPGQPGYLFEGVQNLFQATDTFSKVRGAHSLKLGGDVQRIPLNITSASSAAGFYAFGGLLPFLAGTPSRFTVLLPTATDSIVRGWRRTDVAWFVQDDFRLRPNLTLNLGFRHEFFTDPSEVNGKSARLINLSDPRPTVGPPFKSRKGNFSPRVGVAWDPTGNGKTSVRAGAGIFYSFLDGRTWYFPAERNSIFSESVAVANPPFPNAVASAFTGGGRSLTYTLLAKPHEPAVIHYNLEVQRELAPKISARLSYIGATGYHMPTIADENTPIPSVQSDGTLFFAANAPLMNRNLAEIFALRDSARYNYNALQAMLQKTFSASLQFQASYTYAKTMSNADEYTNGELSSVAPTILNIRNQRGDYSRSAFDQRHTFVLNAAYQMPWDKLLNGRLAKTALGGWAINGIYSYGSGLAADILTGFNQSRNGDSFQTDRPNLVPGFSNNPRSGVTAGCQGILAGQKLRTPTRWFDPCAFALQPAGTFGNLGRNTLTGPGVSNLDFTLVKTTALTEQKKLEFRAEFFNLPNHARFGLPVLSIFNSTGAHSGNAGRITSTAGDNRELQLGLKFIF